MSEKFLTLGKKVEDDFIAAILDGKTGLIRSDIKEKYYDDAPQVQDLDVLLNELAEENRQEIKEEFIEKDKDEGWVKENFYSDKSRLL